MRLFLLVLLSLPIFSYSQNKLTIEVTGVPNSDGNIRVAIYNTSDSFLSHDEVFKSDSVLASKGVTRLSMEDIPDGEYAVVLYHDENDNDELDTNWLGIPKEPVGFSNAKMKTFGPPKFKECSFVMEPETQVKVVL